MTVGAPADAGVDFVYSQPRDVQLSALHNTHGAC